MRTYYEVINARRTKSGPCPVCGKTATRSRTFEQTVNPFNRNADGTPRTRAEVLAAVEAVAAAWAPDFTHTTCTVA